MAVAFDVIAQDLRSDDRAQAISFEARTSMAMRKPYIFDPGFLGSIEQDKNWKPFLQDRKSLLAALPEALLSRLSATMPGRDNVKKALSSLQKDCLFLCADVDFANVNTVLLGHPVSAVGDWIGLLADIGRASRAATALGARLEALVAGVSWMYDNRSIFQFIGQDLSEENVESGLCMNFDRRLRLYSALGITANVKDIAAYDGKDTISRQKLEELSSFYTTLAETIFGVSNERLTEAQVKLMASRTPQAFYESYPQHIQVLIDAGLFNMPKDHVDLEIIGRIARQFNRLDPSVFRYFFAQWFAQQEYRGKALKCAVFTERTFDRLFDDLNGEIKKRWLPEIDAASAPLPAAYFSHYRIGRLQLLPYNPLSLDALRMKFRSHLDVQKLMCPLDGSLSVREISTLLSTTPLGDLNRLLADVASFILFAYKQVPAAVEDACKRIGSESPEDVFAVLSPELADSWQNETEMQAENANGASWLSWLEAIDQGKQAEHMPLHIWFLLQDSWNAKQIQKGASIIALARETYQGLTRRNWLGT